jgi:hypothetical protein
MKLKHHEIVIESFYKNLIDSSKEIVNGPRNNNEDNQDFCQILFKMNNLLSFDISSNFERLLISSKVVSSKPKRVCMKFETFDYNFAIHYIDESFDAESLINSYYTFKTVVEGHSFISDLFGIYSITYRWFSPFKIIVYDQSEQL